MDMQPGEVRKLLEYHTVSIRDGIPTTTEGFYVHLENPDVALGNAEIPQSGDPHPDNAGLIARSVNAAPRGRGSLVQVSYTAPEYVGGSGPSVNTYDEAFIGKDVSFDYDDIDIPLFRRVGIETTDADNLPISQLVYAGVDSGIPYRKRTPYYRVETGVTFAEAPTIEGVFALTQAIVDQVDKIHVIGGKELLFACEGIDQRKADEFKVVYRWTEDKGIPNEWPTFDETIDGGFGRIGTTLYPFFDDDFVIPPFQGLRIDGDPDPTNVPKLTYFNRFKRDDNGWQNLPGLT